MWVWLLAHWLIIAKVAVIIVLAGIFYLIYWVRYVWKPPEEDNRPFN